MSGLIGKKIGMMSVFSEEGRNIPCTVIKAGPCIVTQVKTMEKDGYEAVQLGYDDKKDKNTPKPLLGHFKKAKSSPKRKLFEFSFDFEKELKLGDEVKVDDVFKEGVFVDVAGTSKGKGFQGVVKRHGFAGVGDATHGQHNRNRAPGSIGAASYPARVFKGMKMAGRTGGNRVKMQNLEIVKILSDNNLLVVKGAVAGHNGSYLIIEK